MKHILPILLALSVQVTLIAQQTFTTVQDGDWESASTWQNGQIPDLTAAQTANPYQVNILHNVTAVTSSGDVDLELDGTSSLYIASGASLTTDGFFEIKSGATISEPFHLAGTLTVEEFIFDNTTATVNHTGTLNSLDDFEIRNGTYHLEGTLTTVEDVRLLNSGVLRATDATINSDDDLKAYDDSEIYLDNTDLTATYDIFLYDNHVLNLSNGSTMYNGRDIRLQNYAALNATDATITSDDDMEGHDNSTIYLSNTTVTLDEDLRLEENHVFELADGSSLTADDIRLNNQADLIGIGPSNTISVIRLLSSSPDAELVCAYGGTLSNTTSDSESVNEFQQTCTANAISLPVTWLAFEATSLPNGVELYWSTAMELNNEYFDIQRSLDEGETWTPIAKVSGMGNTQSMSEYTYTDLTAPAIGTIYYRLRQVDFDGTAEYSPIALVENREKNLAATVTVYPNPTAEHFQLELQDDVKLDEVALFDTFGRAYPMNDEWSKSSLRFELPAQLQSGTYILVLNTNLGRMVKQLIVTR